jgi:hypothetical protein
MKSKNYRSHFQIEMRTLDLPSVKEGLTEQLKLADGRLALLDRCRQLQLSVYVMCGGGFLGRFAAEQPADFYIDDRAATAFPSEVIYQAVKVLEVYANVLELDPHNLQPSKELNLHSFMNHHNCGIF